MDMNNKEMELVLDPAQKFVYDAGHIGIIDEAAFVAALLHSDSGKDFMKHFRKKKKFAADDDISLAYLIYEEIHSGNGTNICEKDRDSTFMETLEKIKSTAEEIQKKVTEIRNNRMACRTSELDVWGAEKEWGSDLYYLESNLPHVPCGLFSVRSLMYKVAEDLNFNMKEEENRCMVVHALRRCFVRNFMPTNLLYLVNTSLGLKCYSHTHMKEVEFSKHAVSQQLPPNANFTYLVACKLKNREEGPMLAKLISRVPISQRHNLTSEIVEYQYKIGERIMTHIIEQEEGYIGQICKDFAVIVEYRKENSILKVITTQMGSSKLQTYIEEKAEQLGEEELNWNVLQCQMGDFNELIKVTFGPGFSIHSIATDRLYESCTIKFATQNMVGPLQGIWNNIVDILTEVCQSQMDYTPIIFVCNNNLYATFKSPKDISQCTQQMKFPFGFENSTETLFEFMLSENILLEANNRKNLPSGNCMDECVICLNQPTNEWIQLAYCGHTYCKECLIDLVKNVTIAPLRCLICSCLISIHDMRILFSEHFSSITELRTFLMPILCRILDSFLQNNNKYVRCKTANCHNLMPAKGVESARCYRCDLEKCGNCGDELHFGISCSQKWSNEFLKNEPELLGWLNEDKETRRICPNKHCNFMLEKAPGGCHHFECRNCHIHFCWLCDYQAKTSQDIYAHLLAKHGGYGNIQIAYPNPYDFNDYEDELRHVPPSPTYGELLKMSYKKGQAHAAYQEYKTQFHELPFLW